MITNRELTMDDYLAMLRRRAKLIWIPALVALLLGFLAYLVVLRKYAKYTSQSIVLVEGQKVPENMVQPVVSDDLQARIGMLRTVATSDSELRPVLQKLLPNKSAQEVDEILEDMRSQPQLVGAPFADLSQITGSTVKKKPGQSESPGFMISYTAADPRIARDICEALTSKIIQKNSQFIQDNAKGTVDVLSSGLENAKHALDDMDAKLAAFKKEHSGQLPTDQDNNLKMLMTYSQQQDSFTQRLNLAQQDKSYNESMLAQQLAAWKTSQSATNPETLQKQLSDLQSQLVDLRARYTDDHPDVIKTQSNIAEVKKKLAEINKASSDTTDAGNDKASATEPLEIRQIRQQIHRDEDEIGEDSRELKRLQTAIAQAQQHLSMSPSVEEQYNQLTRDYENAAKSYQDLLASKSKADLTANMTNREQGERMNEIQPASLPDSPSFPVIWYFLGGGVAAGMALGCGLALWLEMRDNAIRTEADAEAALELPMLVAVPWVGTAATEEKNGKFWHRGKKSDVEKETISV